MGEKVSGAFEFGYELVDEGPHSMSVETADVVKNEDTTKGWTYKIRAKVQGGESDGRGHFEQFQTKTRGNFGLRKLIGFCIKTGFLQAKDYDSDIFETEQFATKFKQGLIGKLFGAEIIHITTKQGKTMSNSKAYYTVQEAKDKMIVGTKGNTPPDPKLGGEKKVEQSDSWE
jgi:hypothetical protein